MEVIANQFVSEDTASADLVITFPWRCRAVEIINDSANESLGYKFNASEDYATLEPLEVANPPVKQRQVILNGLGAYRVRAYG